MDCLSCFFGRTAFDKSDNSISRVGVESVSLWLRSTDCYERAFENIRNGR